MKTNHLPYFLLLLFLQLVRSGANESISGEDDGVHRATQLLPAQLPEGLNATVALSSGEGTREQSKGLHAVRRVGHSKGGSGGGSSGGGRGRGTSVGAGGSQTVREPRSQKHNDATSVLLLNCSLARIVFQTLLVSVIVF